MHNHPRLIRAAMLATLAATAPRALASPVERVLHDFNVVRGGNTPQAALIAGPGGVYYGTNDRAGAFGNGTVFALVPPAAGQAAWTETVIHAFAGPADGATPSSGLLLGKDGALYGVTGGGGVHGHGVVFRLAPPTSGGTAWTETTLYSFTGNADGSAPFGTLVADANGVLYGATAGGGAASNAGVVFSLAPPGAGRAAWTQTVLHSFKGDTDGASPAGGVVIDSAGALYGMTAVGGEAGDGLVYRLAPPAAGGSSWTIATLHSFTGQPDGNFPVGALVMDAQGMLYGSTYGGGSSGHGAAFVLAPPTSSKSPWFEKVIYSFTGGAAGSAPDASLVLGDNGTVFGTTQGGGKSGNGVVFALTPPASASLPWSETAIASLDGPLGANPIGLLRTPEGTLVGTAYSGGARGGGTAFALAPPAAGQTTWTPTTLYAFAIATADAANPDGGLLLAHDGAFYGSSNNGGDAGQGAVYQLLPPAAGQSAWRSSVIHSFSGPDGALAIGKLAEGKGGVLYGVTNAGGLPSGFGTVYALTPPAAGQTKWTERVIHTFAGVTSGDGAYPNAGIIIDGAGVIYGTASNGGVPASDNSFGDGIVFRLTPPAGATGAWSETVLHSFTGPDGSSPLSTLLRDKSGAFYGTTYTGGAAGDGTVFKLTPPASGGHVWTSTVVHSFDPSANHDGAIPGAEQLLQDSAGALYGTASQGGAGNVGIVFKLSPPTGTATNWTETILHNFTGPDGTGPFTSLIASPGGGLYGTTSQGGDPTGCQSPFGNGCGTVYKLSPPATGTSWPITVLHLFTPTYGKDGANPAGALTRDKQGNIYGVTGSGGFGQSGTVFEVTP